jgi:UDP-N-acetylglucosamine diphosphorylase/glucosamine-1-phosphate N-acetyltransferase
MRICLIDDRRVADWYPLTLTRPASDLVCGLHTLGEKQSRYFRASAVSYLCRPALASWLRARDPQTPVNDAAWLRCAPTVLVNGRWLPPAAHTETHRAMFTEGPFLGLANGEVAFAVLDTRRMHSITPHTVDDCLHDWLQILPCREVGGTVLARPWDLIEHNGEEIENDFHATRDPAIIGFRPADIALVGPAERLAVHPSAHIDPHVVADTRRGPVVIGEGVNITAFTRLEGPCAIGAHTHLHAAQIRAGTTIGPHCRIGGEVEASVVLGYSNKYHEGFLGHSYLGEWVNLAAGTITGDLRYDYRDVTVRINNTHVPSGRMKLGSIIGDHAKTGLGVLLDCGSVLDVFSQVMPTGTFAPRSVPAFTRVGPDGAHQLEFTRLVAAAETAMARRGKSLPHALELFYRSLAGEPAQTEQTPATLPLRKIA